MTNDAGLDPLFGQEVVENPHNYYRRLRQTDPVHEVAGTGTFVVTPMALIHQVVGDPETFSNISSRFLHLGEWPEPALRPAMSGLSDGDARVSVATTDPPDHTRLRKVVVRRLAAGNVQRMEGEFRTLFTDALSEAGADGRLEWMSRVAEPLPMVMVARVLGLPDALAPELKQQGYAMVERISGFVPEERIQPLEDAGVGGLVPVIEAYTQAKEGTIDDANGLIGIVKRAVDDQEISDLEAFGILSVIIAAGGESTTSLIGTAARILAERTDLQQRLRREPDLVPTFVEEALRHDPPFRGHYRVATRDTELGGTEIPAGSHLLLAWPAANRDDATYPDADQIRLDRPRPRQHVGFGWGIHLCVGAPLARMEAKVAIEALLAHTPRFRLDPAQQPLRYHPSLVVRRLAALPLLLN
ncbi:cytochrome P450 [Actinomadura craniellae]|uniref:Cytochrome P450 n=1 Tax=Actinomadura craniellae TaxID=2231787 RepID=A0A365H615_9ACTN|nr:cytochrome P450 [Actinomadura craniellae]RAY14554.1 cytochrome P450 [Actinomadura craniellae]